MVSVVELYVFSGGGSRGMRPTPPPPPPPSPEKFPLCEIDRKFFFVLDSSKKGALSEMNTALE